MNQSSLFRFRKLVGRVTLLFAAVHVMLCCFFLLTPASNLSRTTIGLLYDRLVLTGPFFSADRIQSSPHLLVRFKTDQGWSPFSDKIAEAFQNFNYLPWQYRHLLLRDYARSVASEVFENQKQGKVEKLTQSVAFERMHKLILHNADIKQSADSVQVIYYNRWYDPATSTARPDTLINIKYNATEVESAK